ncbi:hypothetical protein F5I97DRAFT_1928299 [Phlebopus sp. FC_14]|nr:hypothetical protein F5I97DRAFT_1928299 [Phlebopus sp. FC_14]
MKTTVVFSASLRKLLQWLQKHLRKTVACPLNFLWILVGLIRSRWRPQRKKKLNIQGASSTPDVVGSVTIRPSEVPSVLVSQHVDSPSPISRLSDSSHSTVEQNGNAFLVPPAPGDGPQIAPSLISASDVHEEVDIALNPASSVEPLHHDPATPMTPYSAGGHLSLSMSMPEPAQVATTSSSLRVNWGAPPRPSERIPRQIIPVPAQSIMRYNRKVRIRGTDSKYTIFPGTKEFIDPHRRHLGEWEPLIHPEGALYFKHPSRRICTDANLYKNRNMDVITRCADALFERMKSMGIEFSEDSELVLEIMDDKRANIWRCGYYFVDHTYRCLFWLDPFQAEPIFGNRRLRAQLAFRMHCELFPDGCTISRPIWEHLKLTLLHATAETITSDTSLSPFDREELSKMLELTKDLEGSSQLATLLPDVDTAPQETLATTILTQYAFLVLADVRFFNFCGQVGARLDVDQTVYYSYRERRSILLVLMSPLLFGAPDVHAVGLRNIWVDQLVNHISWKRFINRLNSEWQEFTLYGTVVLNANVAFLAISDLNYAAQVSSYVSIVCSVGAVILGLLLVRQNRTKGRDSAEEAVSFMTRMTYSMFGMETLAVLYSMPYALLIMIFFVLAFSFLAFQGSTLVTRASVGAATGFVALFVFWAVWSAWECHLPQYWIYFLRLINARRRRSSRRRYSGPLEESEAVTSDSEVQ